MKKIVITILALLFMPIMVGATADALTLDDGTNIEVNGITLGVNGLVDDMVITGTNVTFSLSTNSVLTITSNNRYQLANNLVDILCGSSNSQISVTGSSGSSLVVTPDTTVCSKS